MVTEIIKTWIEELRKKFRYEGMLKYLLVFAFGIFAELLMLVFNVKIKEQFEIPILTVWGIVLAIGFMKFLYILFNRGTLVKIVVALMSILLALIILVVATFGQLFTAVGATIYVDGKKYAAHDATWHHVNVQVYEDYGLLRSRNEFARVEEDRECDAPHFKITYTGSGEHKHVDYTVEPGEGVMKVRTLN
ncbi:MAG: hypothetical protein MJ123_05675 [Lachnospiraceae bacterium]|nr:hypothetical protein [Lachnospiraceae bacterium]